MNEMLSVCLNLILLVSTNCYKINLNHKELDNRSNFGGSESHKYNNNFTLNGSEVNIYDKEPPGSYSARTEKDRDGSFAEKSDNGTFRIDVPEIQIYDEEPQDNFKGSSQAEAVLLSQPITDANGSGEGSGSGNGSDDGDSATFVDDEDLFFEIKSKNVVYVMSRQPLDSSIGCGSGNFCDVDNDQGSGSGGGHSEENDTAGNYDNNDLGSGKRTVEHGSDEDYGSGDSDSEMGSGDGDSDGEIASGSGDSENDSESGNDCGNRDDNEVENGNGVGVSDNNNNDQKTNEQLVTVTDFINSVESEIYFEFESIDDDLSKVK